MTLTEKIFIENTSPWKSYKAILLAKKCYKKENGLRLIPLIPCCA